MKYHCWPPPNWTEVVVSWSTMLDASDYAPNAITDWTENTIQGRWHLHGYRATEGFAFRFEDPRDATLFRLRWPHDS